MKTHIPPTMLACLVASSLVAQTATPPPSKVPPPEPPAGVPKTEAHVETVIRDASGAANDAVRTGLKAAHAAMAEAGKAAGKGMALQFGAGAKSSSRSLAIQTSDVDREKVDAIEEDLSVMARILQKAARSLRDDDRFSSMGVDLDTSFFGSASGARNIYLEGHGALFLLRVEYPLVGPQENAEPQAKQAPPSTIWDETREEVLGHNSEQDSVFVVRRGRSEPYDEAKVDGLKTALLDALKNASNIRFLAPQEFITVVVQGGDATTGGNGRTDVRVRKETRGNNEAVTTRRTLQKGESVMTVRVTKADVDAYAAGKMDPEAFRRKTTIQTYLRRGEQARTLR